MTAQSVYIGGGLRHFVFGSVGGADFIAMFAAFDDAQAEYDDRFGDVVRDEDPDLADYDGDNLEDKLASAIEAGDVRTVPWSGVAVWVDPNEWFAAFDDVKDAMRRFTKEP